MTEVKVRGVYATAHLDTGDFEVQEVASVSINGALVTFCLYRADVPLGGTLMGSTIHLGPDLSLRVGSEPAQLIMGDNLAIFHKVETSALERAT